MAARPPRSSPVPSGGSPVGSPGGDTAISLPPLRTRATRVDHSLASQWRGTAGRPLDDSALVSDRQRIGVLIFIFLLAGALVTYSLNSTRPERAHPSAVLSHAHVHANPHMLKHYNRMMAAASTAAGTLLGPGGNATLPHASTTASPYSVLYVTVPNSEVAEKLASGLLQKRLVACANIVPTITSMYWWEGAIQKEQEQLVMLKTRSALFTDVAAFVKANHPYQVPEVVELPIQQGTRDYLQWIGENTKEPGEP